MVRVRVMILSVAITASVVAHCQLLTIENDPVATAYYGENIANRTARDAVLNEYTKKNKEKQDDNLAKIGTMETMLQDMMLVMSNVESFGYESSYYKQIAADLVAIVQRAGQISREIYRHPATPGTAMAALRVTNIVDKARGLVTDFCSIVANGKIRHPSGDNVKKDGLNLIQPEKRLGMAVRICSDIREIRWQLDIVLLNFQYATWGDVWRRIDYRGWANIIGMDANARYAISRWNSTFSK